MDLRHEATLCRRLCSASTGFPTVQGADDVLPGRSYLRFQGHQFGDTSQHGELDAKMVDRSASTERCGHAC